MAGKPWTRDEVLVAFNLYCRTPFGRLHARNPEIVAVAQALGRSPAALAMKCCNLAAFDPALKRRGIKGLSKVSQVDREVWEAFQQAPEEVGFESEEQLARVTSQPLRQEETVEWRDVSGLEREAVTKVRVNQHLFRSIVLAGYREACAVCGLPIERLLIASHIVPWSIDAANRMNPRNGICLCSLHDRAYDAGVLLIDAGYCVRLTGAIESHRPNDAVCRLLVHYEGRQIRLPERWHPDPQLLKRHCELVLATIPA